MDKIKILVGEKELGSSTNSRDKAYKDTMVGKIIIVKKKTAKHYFHSLIITFKFI